MRKYYLDNIRWVTVVLVVIYHVIYMYNGEGMNMLQILSGQSHRKGICEKQDKEAAYSLYRRTICVSVHPGICQHVNKRRF